MGKIKQKRHVLHLPAPKSNDLEHQRFQIETSEEFQPNRNQTFLIEQRLGLKNGLVHYVHHLFLYNPTNFINLRELLSWKIHKSGSGADNYLFSMYRDILSYPCSQQNS